MIKVKLYDIAKTIRSKNAGIDQITFDIIFKNEDLYNHIEENQLIAREDVCDVLSVDEDDIDVLQYFDPAKAVKITIDREIPNGNPGDSDVYGAQQYPPLYGIEIEIPETFL